MNGFQGKSPYFSAFSRGLNLSIFIFKPALEEILPAAPGGDRGKIPV